MRNKTFEEQEKEYPYSIYFIHNFINYILENGISANELSTKYLYSGVTSEFALQDNLIVENCFISTSFNQNIAKTFSTNNGNLMIINVTKLFANVKCLVIDESVEDYLHEEEVLFLPGFLVRKNIYNNNILEYEYKMNDDLINKYTNVDIKVKLGGTKLLKRKIPHIELKNKLVIWYRAIQNRKVEIIGDVFIPKDIEKIPYFFKHHVLRKDDEYQHISKLIPEYQDIKDMPNMNKLKDSYMVHMAIYDYKKNKITTMCYGLFNEFYEQLFDQTRVQEAKDTIIKQYSFLSTLPVKKFTNSKIQ
jgi:hypothetical protein